MLREALNICDQIGLKEILITCNQNNEASRKTITKCGGVYINSVIENDLIAVERYFIYRNYTPLAKAYDMAMRLHAGQVDRSNVPYFYHLLIVALSLNTKAERIVAFLHDVLEDCPITFDELALDFNHEICTAVKLLTHNQDEDYGDYIQKIKINPLARAVKLADLSHNSNIQRLSRITSEDLTRQKKYLAAIAILNN